MKIDIKSQDNIIKILIFKIFDIIFIELLINRNYYNIIRIIKS